MTLRARAQPPGDKGGMGHQHLAAFEQRAGIAQFDAFGVAIARAIAAPGGAGTKRRSGGEKSMRASGAG